MTSVVKHLNPVVAAANCMTIGNDDDPFLIDVYPLRSHATELPVIVALRAKHHYQISIWIILFDTAVQAVADVDAVVGPGTNPTRRVEFGRRCARLGFPVRGLSASHPQDVSLPVKLLDPVVVCIAHDQVSLGIGGQCRRIVEFARSSPTW